MTQTRDAYKEEVIDPNDRVSRLAKDVNVNSYGNSPAVTIVPHQPDNFRGPVSYLWNEHVYRMMAATRHPIHTDQVLDWVMAESIENDGAGGKPQFCTILGTPEAFYGLPWEIIVMNADDFSRSGRLSVLLANNLDVKSITEQNYYLFEAMFDGFSDALKRAGLVSITGETAVMKHSITAWCETDPATQLIMTWGATCLGLTHKKLLIDGSRIRPGQAIVGFWEHGYRCNGGTFFTNIILERWGHDPRLILDNIEARAFIEKLTKPSISYARTISRLVGWKLDGTVGEPIVNITGIAHITGGGVWGKFGELLPPGVGANLNSMPKPADVLLEAQSLSWGTKFQLPDWRAYSTLHGGCGMLVIVDLMDCDRLIAEAYADGIQASVVGETTESEKSEILIQSRFKEGKLLSSLNPE